MATIKDLRVAHYTTHFNLELCGAEEGFVTEYKARLRAIGAALCREQGFDVGDKRKLPDTIELGAESGRLFAELKKWLDESKCPVE